MNKLVVVSVFRSKLDDNRGTPIRVRSLLREMSECDDIRVISFSWDANPVLAGMEHHHMRNNHWEDIQAIARVVRKEKAHIVMGHTMATWYYLVALKFLTGVKIFLEMHGFLEEEARLYGTISPLRFWFEKLVYGVFYSLCDGATTSSDTATQILSRYNKNVKTVWGGVDLTLFNPSVTSGNYLPNVAGLITIGYAGNTRTWQGVDFLAATFATLRLKHPEFRLALLVSEAKGIPVGEGVTVVAGVSHDKVSAFLAECDILVIPRMHNEVNRISFPSKLIEYMAMGKPVVASATSDCHKVIRDGIDGFVYEPGDAEALTDILVRLKDASLRVRIGQEGYATVKKAFTWQHQADLTVTALTQTLRP